MSFKPFIKYPVVCHYRFGDGVAYCMFTDGVLLKYVGGVLDEKCLYPADHCLNDTRDGLSELGAEVDYEDGDEE